MLEKTFSISLMASKQGCETSFLDAYEGHVTQKKTAIFNAPKAAPSTKEMNLHFHSDQRENQVFPDSNRWVAIC